ncbi:kinase-like protein, partial [Trematosphaeria pertusa]
LGEGTEGKVSLWRHKWKEEHIAVKQPARGTDFHRNMLKQELKNLKMVGTHPNVVSLLGWDDYYAPIPPGIFLDYCQLGDLLEYQNLLVDAGHYVPEESIWKFLVDMSRGLDYLHNHLAVPYIHGDLKPSNILVARPPGCRNDEVPLLPIFKLADISRLVPYIPGQGPNHMFFGTPEYGPPFSERRAVAPAVDIYAIGATVQHLALGCYPTQDRKAFIREVMLQGMDAPHEKDLNHIKWRNLIPVVYRPINAAAEEQRTKYKLQHPNPPYSDVLNDWYSMCLEHEKHRRISADILTDWFVPLAEGQIEVLAAKRERDRAADIARKLRETAT